MIYNNVVLTVQEETNVETVKELLREQGRLSREEPGCERFEVYHSQADPCVFMLIEQWVDQAALDVHRTAPAYVEIYQPKVIPLIERVPHPSEPVE